MNTNTIEVAVNDQQYRITIDGETVSIDRWNASGFWEWSGDGKLDGGSVVDCTADLGDDVYEAIDAAIEAAEGREQ